MRRFVEAVADRADAAGIDRRVERVRRWATTWARRGAPPNRSPNNSRTDALERRIDKSSTAAGMRASAASNALKAASGSPEPEKAASSAGTSSVSTSRARRCEPPGGGRNASRGRLVACSGCWKPRPRNVVSVSGSSPTPVNTRLPASSPSVGASSNRLA